MIIKKLDVLSVGKITGIIAAAFGLLAGLLMLVFGSLFAGILGSQGESGGLAALGGGIVGLIALPILYGIAGFIGGLIQAVIYNLAAGVIGGIRIETE
ncbi:hypothetical protein FZO89_14485 [Luteimonas viscosa]|uniref:DUF3566 domain-containing protein n=1 Tax=Luteimonas viscosa TaxID=1132694 RepID=A0A5D4XRM9_9GAMM|nr:hypothetical protein [Luteimonas viscosa]TYT27368.1 hypothetical protein FZO89_14485 [Luteimonas viscosa]